MPVRILPGGFTTRQFLSRLLLACQFLTRHFPAFFNLLLAKLTRMRLSGLFFADLTFPQIFLPGRILLGTQRFEAGCLGAQGLQTRWITPQGFLCGRPARCFCWFCE